MLKRKCFVIDFDETVTVHDTIKNIVQAGIELNKRNLPATVTYKSIEDFYVKTYSQLNAQKLSDLPNAWDHHHAHRQCEVTFRYKNEYNYQSFIRSYEVTTLQNIENCEIFKGVCADDLVNLVAPQLGIRSGFGTFLGKNINMLKDGKLCVLSLNFSRELICSLVKGINKNQVYCDYLETSNVFESEQPIRYNGNLHGEILVGSDKCDALFDMLESSCASGKCKASSNHVENWYIGDSRSDYLSILHPLVDVGCLLIDEQNTGKLQKCCDFFEVGELQYGDITSVLLNAGWLPSNTCKKVYLVRDWHEIDSLCV